MRNPVESSRRVLLRRRILIAVVTGASVMLLLQQNFLESSQPAPSADRMAAELIRAAERASICSAANAVGVGLRGEYFFQESFRGPVAQVRVDSVVDFEPSLEWPTITTPRPLSVRWSGWIKAPLTGRYRFHADAPNVRVLVQRNLVAGSGANPEGMVDLAAGRFYPIEISVSQLTGSNKRIRLEWTAPHGARYVIPKALLHLPTEMVETRRI